MSSTQNSWDLYSDLAYTYELDALNCPVEQFIVSFTNLRSDVISAHLNFTGQQLSINGNLYDVISAKLVGFQGLNVASSCGRTELNNDESNYTISTVDLDVDVSLPVNLPAYTTGQIEVLIKSVNLDCNPVLGLIDNFDDNLLLNVYPSPARSSIWVDLPESALPYTSSLRITNSLGQIVKEVKVAEAVTQIDIQSLEIGLYFIQVVGSTLSRPSSFLKL